MGEKWEPIADFPNQFPKGLIFLISGDMDLTRAHLVIKISHSTLEETMVLLKRENYLLET